MREPVPPKLLALFDSMATLDAQCGNGGPRPIGERVRLLLDGIVDQVLDEHPAYFAPYEAGGIVLELRTGLEAWFPFEFAALPKTLYGEGLDQEGPWL